MRESGMSIAAAGHPSTPCLQAPGLRASLRAVPASPPVAATSGARLSGQGSSAVCGAKAHGAAMSGRDGQRWAGAA
jgi:hypothetical protein